MTDSEIAKRDAAMFKELCEAEPLLQSLLREAKKHRRNKDERFCANEAWYGYNGNFGLKPRLVRLVGFERSCGPEFLQTQQAYDVAYQAIYDVLPNCRGGCWCL